MRWLPVTVVGIAAALMATGVTAHASTPTALPDSAVQWQSTFNAIHDGSWSGGDGGQSTLLPDGRDLVMYADTFAGSVMSDGARGPDTTYFHNSFAIVSGDQVAWINAPGQELIPTASDGTEFWPETAVVTGNDVRVFAIRAQVTGPALSDIHVVGQSMVTFDLSTWTIQSNVSLTDQTDNYGIWWSAGSTVDSSYLYLYGVQLAQPGDEGRSVYVSRVPLESVDSLSTWQYWNGVAWTSDSALGAAAQLITGEADTVVSVWHSGTMWYLVSQKYGLLGSNIELWTATAPQGPWQDTKTLYTIAPSAFPDGLFYEGAAHPEVALASGNLLLSYSRNGSWDHVNADADWYMPQYVEASLGPEVAPDLVVTNVGWSPADPSPGGAVQFSATVRNSGTAPTQPGTVIGVDFLVAGQRVTWSNDDTTALTPGSSVTLTANAGNGGTATWAATRGGQTIQAQVDPSNAIAELSETNNALSVPMNVYASAAPTSAAITAGKLRSGSVKSLAKADAVTYQVNSTTASTRTVNWNATVPKIPRNSSGLRVTYTGAASRSSVRSIYIYNYSTKAWVLLSSATVGTALVTATLVPSGGAARYVSGSAATGSVRVLVKSTSTAGTFYNTSDLLAVGFL